MLKRWPIIITVVRNHAVMQTEYQHDTLNHVDLMLGHRLRRWLNIGLMYRACRICSANVV